MQRKSFALQLKEGDSGEGTFRARIATLNVVDKDGDVSLPGSFPVGKSVVISAYMHGSWQGALPVGKGVIGANDKEAWVDGEFFVNTTHGKDTYQTVKALSDAGLQEWSYGYEPTKLITESDVLEKFPGALRVFEKQDVYECSPVLIGAGVNTATESIKSAKLRQIRKAIGGKAVTLTPDTLATIAQIDSQIDAVDELLDSLMDQLGIPDPDETPADEADDAKGFTYQDHAKNALTSVQSFVARSKSLAALRAKEGRTLSTANRERLTSLLEALTGAGKDIQTLLAETEPDAGKSADPELEAAFLNLQRMRAKL